MYETIYLAQESKDEACITRALTLMHKLLLASCKGDILSLYMVRSRAVLIESLILCSYCSGW
jgi:hypothetical protein